MNKRVAPLLFMAVSSAAHADMIVRFSSDPHDFVGQGLAQTLTYTTGNFGTSVDANGNLFMSGNTGAAHTIGIQLYGLKNVAGGAPAPGMCYARALDSNDQPNGRPGMNVSMDSRGCSDSMAQYQVRELTVSAGKIQTLAVDLVQHCSKFGGPAIFANVRINSAIAETTPFIAPVYTATGSLQFTAAGTGIGSTAPGKTATISISPALLLPARNRFSANGLTFMYNGPLPGVASDANWELDFGAPDHAVVTAGTYNNAIRYPFQTAGIPGLDFTYNGAGSNMVSGSFIVSSATYEPIDGNVQDFTTSFVHNREGNTANQTTGSISYNAVFNNGQLSDRIFASGFESGEIPTPQILFAYPCN